MAIQAGYLVPVQRLSAGRSKRDKSRETGTITVAYLQFLTVYSTRVSKVSGFPSKSKNTILTGM